MKKRSVTNSLMNKRMFDRAEAAAYLGLGLSRTTDFCKKIGAVKHIGRRALFDRTVIDRALDDLGNEQKEA